MRAHLPDSCIVKDLASFFEVFLRKEDYNLLATNTNKYAKQYLTLYPRNSQRAFKPTNRQEIKVLLAIWIFIGIYRHYNPKSYWISPARQSPIRYMKWKRYKHLKFMIKVSNINQDCEHADVPSDQHFKVSLLDTRLIKRFQAIVTLGSKLSYDEIMLPFRSRSAHVTKVLNKPHPNGFKVWTLADYRYMYDWLYFSGFAGILLC